jgi:branched-chain amino acid transport system permease protein
VEQQIVAISVNVLILSSMYILMAMGFAFLFNMLGILNLAHGAIYMVGGYIGYSIIAGLGVNSWLGILWAMVIVAGLGAFLERFCFRPFVGNFNRTVMVCVALTTIFQTAVNNTVGTKIMAIPAFVQGILKVGSISISYERIVIFSVGALLLLGSIFFVQRTKWGQQMQAIAQNLQGAQLQGIDVHRISSLACALGCGLAGLAGCLMGAYAMLNPYMGDIMLVKVLILVILAGVGSLGGIFAAGFVLGGLDSVLPWVLGGAASEAITVTIVVILLLFRPQGFFGREMDDSSEARSEEPDSSELDSGRRKWFGPAVFAVLVAILFAFPVLIDSPYSLHILILCFIYVIAAMSFRTITISGQFPLAQGAFMGIGAYLSGMASKWLGWPPWVSIPLAALATTCIGILTGYPFARLRTFYYAMGSLFFGIGVVFIIVAGGTWTGGYPGLSGIRPIFMGSKEACYYLFLSLALVSGIVLYRFEASRIGTTLKAIAQSHIVASSVGINEAWYRVFVVAAGCFFAGLAGAGYAHYNRVVAPESFSLTATLWLVMYVLTGGIKNFTGPIIGTFVLFLIPELFRDLKMYSPYISAGILIIVVYCLPEGLASLPRLIRSSYGKRKKAKELAAA